MNVHLTGRLTDESVSIRASMPVQWFLAYRIKILSHSWIIFGGILSLSLAQGACGIAGGISATLLSKCVECWIVNARPPDAHTVSLSAADFKSLIPVATSWLSIAVLTDGQQ
jgi:hypothetical protein